MTKEMVRCGLGLALATILILTGCGGGDGSVAPTEVVAISLPSTTLNPPNVVNQSTVSGVFFSVALSENATPQDVVTVTVTNGAEAAPEASGVSATAPGVFGGGTISVGPMDLSSLGDGILLVTVTVASPTRGTNSETSATVEKDTRAPNAPLRISVHQSEAPNQSPDGLTTPPDTINLANQNHVVLDLRVGETWDSSDIVTLTLTDSTNQTLIQTLSPPAANGTTTLPGIDCSAFVDGPVTFVLNLSDAVGNTTQFTGTTAIKDTFVPAPLAGFVAEGPDNAANFINASSASAVTVEVQLGEDSVETDQISVSMSYGIVTTAQSGTTGVGTLTFTGIDTQAALDGSIGLALVVSDDRGNRVIFPGTPAMKDTDIGSLVWVRVEPTASNPTGVINAASVPVTVMSGSVAGSEGDSAVVSLTDINGVTIATSESTVTGGFFVTYPIGTHLLADGPIALSVSLTDAAGNASVSNGGFAQKRTSIPPAPLSVFVPSGANNPAGYINAATANATQVIVELPSILDTRSAGEPTLSYSVQLTVSDLAGGTVSAQTSAVPGATMATLSVATGSLMEGPITLSAMFADQFGNLSPARVGSAIMDRHVAQPIAAQIPAGPFNAVNFVSLGNVSATRINFRLSEEATNVETFDITLSIGANQITRRVRTPSGGGAAFSLESEDLSGFPDGQLVVSGSSMDVAGNSAAFGPFTFTKDTTPPAAATSTTIAAGAMNAQGVINGSNVSAALAETIFPGSLDGSETAIHTLIDSNGHRVATSPASVPAGGGAASSTPLNAQTLLDGIVMLVVTVTDAAGNSSSFQNGMILKDTIAPTVPDSAYIASAPSTPALVINESGAASVTVEVNLPSSSVATDMVTVTLNVGAMSVTSMPMTGTPGTGTLTFSGLDVQGFDDGSINVLVSIVDQAQNTVSFVGQTTTLDTTAPNGPSALYVAKSASNDVNSINGASAGSVTVQLDFQNGFTETGTAQVRLSDGVNTVASSVVPTSSTTRALTFAGLVASGLNDGGIKVDVELIDAIGNTAIYEGALATKDAVAPAIPLGANIAAGPPIAEANDADVINAYSQAAVSVDVAWSPAAESSETAIVSLTDGVTTVSSTAQSVTPSGTSTFTLNGTSLAEGPITVSVEIVDATGNQTMFVGTPAIKDSIVPADPTSTVMPGSGPRPDNFVTLANLTNATVQVSFPASSVSTDYVQIFFSQGSSNSLFGGGMSATNGVGTVTFSGLDLSQFQEGAIELRVGVQDAAHNSKIVNAITIIQKDTESAKSPLGLAVLETTLSPANVINASNVTEISVQLTLDATTPFEGTAQIMLTGGATVNSTIESVSTESPTVVIGRIDGTSLSDGPIAVSVTLIDAVGNTTVFAGTPATKDLTAPIGATAASIAMTPSNPAGFINAASASAVQVDVTWDAGANASDTAVIRLGDGGSTVQSVPVSPNPGLTTSVMVNATTLNDGPISITVTTIEPSGNTLDFTGTPGVKDTMAPAMPTLATVPSGPSNGQDIINGATETNVTFAVTWDGTADGAATGEITLSDGASSMTSGTFTVAPSSTQSFPMLSAAALNDGTYALSVTVTDVAGNQATYTGNTVTKDVTPPAAPTALAVAMSADNSADVINIASASSVSVNLTLDGLNLFEGTAQVSLFDGAATALSSIRPVTTGNRTYTFARIDAIGLSDGPITVSVILTDAFGNGMTYVGTTATKDTLAPAIPTAASVPAVMSVNPVDVINYGNLVSTVAEATFSALTLAGEMAEARFQSGVTTVTAGPIAAPPGGGAMAFPGISAFPFMDGNVDLTIVVTDAAGNSTAFGPVALLKDTQPPAPPSLAVIRDDGDNPENVVNANNVAGVAFDVTFQSGSLATDTVTIELSDGATTVNASGAAPVGAMLTTYGPTDASSLNEGPLSLTIIVVDENLNRAQVTWNDQLKDTVAPTNPSAANVMMTVNNPADFVNAASVSNVTVSVTIPADYTGTETVTVGLDDGPGGHSLNSLSQTAPVSGGVMTFSGMDLSAFDEGTINLTVSASDTNGNAANFAGTAATKDTFAPALPTLAFVPIAGATPQDVVNGSTASAAIVQVDWDGTADITATATVVMSDGATTVTVGALAPVVSSGVTYPMANLSGLLDGTLSLTVNVADAAGNTDSFTGNTVIKDTVAPDLPTMAIVASSMSNPEGFINGTSQTAAFVEVTFGPNSVNTDQFQVTLGDGASMAQSMSAAATMGAGSATSGPINAQAATLADGPISVTVDVSDQYGNTASFNGAAAMMDTVAPANPTSMGIAATPQNPADVANIATVATAMISVTYDGTADATAMAIARVTDTATTLASSAMASTPSTTVTYVMNLSTLIEGGITMTLETTDPAGNVSTFSGTPALIDVTAPAEPTDAFAAAGMGNPMHIVNGSNEGDVTVQVNLAAMSVAGDVISVSLGGVPASATQTAAGGAESLTFSGMDVSGLADGFLTVSVIVTDVNLNPTAFTGTRADKDTVAPSAPSKVQVNGTTINPVDFVNAASASFVEILCDFTAGSEAGDTITLFASDGITTLNLGTASATSGAGSVIFVNRDLSSLVDGPLTLSADLSDPAGNVASYGGFSATKDVIAPNAATGAQVAATANNPSDIINDASVSAVQVDVSFGAFNVTDTVQATLSDGQSLVRSAIMPAGAFVSIGGINATTLLDGAIAVSAVVSDQAGNTTTLNGTSATKITGFPVLPLAARVASGMNNAADVINVTTTAAVSVTVDFGSFDGTDQVTVDLSDGVTTINAGPMSAASSVTFAGIDCTGLTDGPISVIVTVTDLGANMSQFTGTPATKDTTPPAAATSVAIDAGAGNSANWISMTSEGAFSVSVLLPSGYSGSETLTLEIDDSVNPVLVPASQPVPSGGGVVTFTGINGSSLMEGALTLRAIIDDGFQNRTTTTGLGGKDITAPLAPTGAAVAASSDNPADWINGVTAIGVFVDVTWGVGVDVNDQVEVVLSDGAQSANSPMTAAPGAPGLVSTMAFDASSLADGVITLTLNVSDLAGNVAMGVGTDATKDVVAPAAPFVDPAITPTNLASQVITGVAPADHGVVVDGGATQAIGTANGSGAFLVLVSLTTDATNGISVRSRDEAWNLSSPVTTDWLVARSLDVVHSSTAPSIPFTDVTAIAGGLGDTGSVSGGGFMDIDSDGDLDLFVGNAGILYQNDGSGNFSVVTGTSFVSDRAAVWGDYDNDGDMDLFLTDSLNGSTLWHNQWVELGTPTFLDVTVSAVAGVGTQLRGAAWFDYNQDGYLDLIVADADGVGNELLRNTGSETFTGIFGSGIDFTLGDPNWISIADLDDNGSPDVVIGDIAPSMMYMNQLPGIFTDNAGVLNSGFDATTSSDDGGMAIADVDNDGDLDIFVCRGAVSSANQLWLNDGAGNFTEVAAIAGVDTDTQAFDPVFGDFNNDSLIDLYLAGASQNVLYLNQGDQVGSDGIPEFVNVAVQTGGQVNDPGDGRLAAAGDIDGDGDLDIFVGNEATGNVLYQNETNTFNFLKVQVRGKGGQNLGSTVDAIGTKVTLRDTATGLPIMYRSISGARGAGAQDPTVVHFGGVIPSRPYDVIVDFPTGARVTQVGVIPAFVTPALLVIEP